MLERAYLYNVVWLLSCLIWKQYVLAWLSSCTFDSLILLLLPPPPAPATALVWAVGHGATTSVTINCNTPRKLVRATRSTTSKCTTTWWDTEIRWGGRHFILFYMYIFLLSEDLFCCWIHRMMLFGVEQRCSCQAYKNKSSTFSGCAAWEVNWKLESQLW